MWVMMLKLAKRRRRWGKDEGVAGRVKEKYSWDYLITGDWKTAFLEICIGNMELIVFA
jgi:hypothetical protein